MIPSFNMDYLLPHKCALCNMYKQFLMIYFSGTKSCNIEVILQSDINKVEQWLLENRLVLNLSKTKVLLFGTIQKLGNVSSFNVKFQDQAIERVSKFIYLGNNTR